MTIPSPPDHSHASAHAARFFDSYFVAKSEHSLDRWMDHFDPHASLRRPRRRLHPGKTAVAPSAPP